MTRCNILTKFEKEKCAISALLYQEHCRMQLSVQKVVPALTSNER
jgi:hypothetical protein